MLAGLAVITMASAQDCTELFISEYLEGSGNNKGLEIYNPTPDMINLSSYHIARYSNGKNSYIDGGITQLEGFIQSFSTHFIVNGQTTSTETSPASDPALRALAQQNDHVYPAPTYMNGNDAIALIKDEGGSGNIEDFVLIDLFGIIGGGMTNDDEGWAGFTDEWIYKNIYDGDIIIGKDSAYVSNYIIPESYYWMPLTSNHSLVRKRNVMHGVTVETMPTTAFNVNVEWDTVPGGVDKWDSLNAHYCACEHGLGVDAKKIESQLSIYPNPANNYVNIYTADGIDDIEVFDISGKTIYTRPSLQGILEKRISLDEFEHGVYFIRVRSGMRVATQKLLLQ